MNLYQAQFGEDLDSPPTPVRRTVLIASTPRCGSHLLGHAMSRTNRLGVPFEYLNPANLAEWSRRLGGQGPAETLTQIMARRTTPNGIFGLKAHYEHCSVLGGPSALFAALPNLVVVHLRRADVMRQAVSYAIARQTGVWISGQEATSGQARFDADLIRACLDDIAVQNAHWSSAFSRAAIEPLNLYYEDLSRDVSGAVTKVGRFAHVLTEGQSVKVDATTTKQSHGDRTERWIDRYASEGRTASPARRLCNRLARVVGQ